MHYGRNICTLFSRDYYLIAEFSFFHFFFYQFYLGPKNKQKRSKAKNINNYFKMAATYVPTRSEVDQLYAEYEEIRRARA